MKLLLLGLFACGQDHMNSESMRRPDEAPKPIPTCGTYARAQCKAIARCSSDPNAECEATLERACKLTSPTDAWLTNCVAWTEAATACPFDRAGGACAR